MSIAETLKSDLAEIHTEYQDALRYLKSFDKDEAEMCIERANDIIVRSLESFRRKSKQ